MRFEAFTQQIKHGVLAENTLDSIQNSTFQGILNLSFRGDTCSKVRGSHLRNKGHNPDFDERKCFKSLRKRAKIT